MRAKVVAAMIVCALAWAGMGYCYRVFIDTEHMPSAFHVFGLVAIATGAWLGRAIGRLCPPREPANGA